MLLLTLPPVSTVTEIANRYCWQSPSFDPWGIFVLYRYRYNIDFDRLAETPRSCWPPQIIMASYIQSSLVSRFMSLVIKASLLFICTCRNNWRPFFNLSLFDICHGIKFCLQPSEWCRLHCIRGNILHVCENYCTYQYI